MGLWDMIAIIAIVAIIAEVVKSVSRSRAKAGSVTKDELTEIRDTISNMQADLDEIKADLSTAVIEIDDLKSNE